MPYNLHHKKFRAIANTDNGEVSSQTLFHYHQEDDLVWAVYQGGGIRKGTLVGQWRKGNLLEFRYQHLSTDGTFKSGECISRPELKVDGKLRLHETWQWTSGDKSRGTSVIEEI